MSPIVSESRSFYGPNEFFLTGLCALAASLVYVKRDYFWMAKKIEKATLSYLSGAPLRMQDGTEIKSDSLWAGKGAVVFAVRRPG